jgi:hypothetical protein
MVQPSVARVSQASHDGPIAVHSGHTGNTLWPYLCRCGYGLVPGPDKLDNSIVGKVWLLVVVSALAQAQERLMREMNPVAIQQKEDATDDAGVALMLKSPGLQE